MGQYLTAVASGRLLAEAVVRLAGNRPALRALSMLDTREQQDVLRTGTVRVLRDSTAEDVPVNRLTTGDISRAFDTINGRIRPVSEQRPAQKRQRPKSSRRVVVQLTENEHAALQRYAAKQGKSVSALVMETLKEGGVMR